MDRRSDLLSGILLFPPKLKELLSPNDIQETILEEFWENLWFNYLKEKHLDTITWFTRFNDPNFFNKTLIMLSRAGWITSVVEMNYAYIQLNESKLLKWISKEELTSIKYQYKFNKYMFTKTSSTLNDIVQINGKHRKTGIIRNGFMKAGNNTFKYDTKYLKKYLPQIAENLLKGLEASTKEITYQEIITALTDYYSVDGSTYTLGNNISDSRGRSIFRCTSKIFNPVSSKDARALLITAPKKLTKDGLEAVYGAIAELLSYRGKDIEDKISYGREAYRNRKLPDIEDLDDLHIRIWLERIYDNLSNTNDWIVPIELDALASLVQFVAVLTNDHTYMDRTNMIGDTFKDIWTVNYVSRTHVKKALTPRLYGSSASPKQLWLKNKLQFTQEQVNKITEELETGIYANANRFQSFIIDNVQPKKKMKVHVWNEVFEIECNRFKWDEKINKSYTIYTSSQGIFKNVYREVTLSPDTQQFKRYFVTLLIHGIDSQVADYICQNIDWILPNHDAFTIHPNDSSKVRKLYTDKLMEIYKNRKTIIRNYFDSVGIVQDYPDKDTEEVDSFLPWCLK